MDSNCGSFSSSCCWRKVGSAEEPGKMNIIKRFQLVSGGILQGDIIRVFHQKRSRFVGKNYTGAIAARRHALLLDIFPAPSCNIYLQYAHPSTTPSLLYARGRRPHGNIHFIINNATALLWYFAFFSLYCSRWRASLCGNPDRKSTRLNSSHVAISYAVFCLKKKKQ